MDSSEMAETAGGEGVRHDFYTNPRHLIYEFTSL